MKIWLTDRAGASAPICGSRPNITTASGTPPELHRELVALEGHLLTLLDHASHAGPTEHDRSTVCWILESNLDADAAAELSHPSD